jgi:hypothetical protein
MIMRAQFTHNNFDFTFSDSDVVNPSDFVPKGEFNPHNVRPFLIHDHGFTVAVAFADCLQDALDAAVDEGKLDRFQVPNEELAAMTEEEQERLSFLGNASEAFDIEGLDVIELANPPFSFASLFLAANKEETVTR